MATIARFEDIKAWQASRELNKKIYTITRKGDFSKDLSLVDQIRRASISVMSNIAEGYERDSNKQFIQFLKYSKGSVGEIRSQLYTAFDQEYVSEKVFEEMKKECEAISGMLKNFITYLKENVKKNPKKNS
jgi:four helix bundle protein